MEGASVQGGRGLREESRGISASSKCLLGAGIRRGGQIEEVQQPAGFLCGFVEECFCGGAAVCPPQ